MCVLLAVAAARPLDWFEEQEQEDPHAAVPGDLAAQVEADGGMSPVDNNDGATSFLQVQTGGHPLECDCERVKCNCVKRCECGLPPAAQNRQATSFLELIGGTPGGERTPLLVDMDTNECFLETGVSVGQDNHHMLDCECDKVKCNCVKHCECSLPAAKDASQNMLQTAEALTPSAPTMATATAKEEPVNTLLEVSEGVHEMPPDEALNDVSPPMGMPAVDNDGDDDEANIDNDDSTDAFLKRAGAGNGPSGEAPPSKARSRAIASKDGVKATEQSYSYSYGGQSDNAAEPSAEYSYSD